MTTAKAFFERCSVPNPFSLISLELNKALVLVHKLLIPNSVQEGFFFIAFLVKNGMRISDLTDCRVAK